MSTTLEALKTQYQELTGKSPHHKKTEEALEKEVKELKSLRAQFEALKKEEPGQLNAKALKKAISDHKKQSEAPDINLGETSVIMKGNMVDSLDDDNPFKTYEFENETLPNVKGKMNKVADFFHVGIIPAQWVQGMGSVPLSKGKSKQDPFTTVLSLPEWQKSKPRYEKATNMIFHVLHDPFKK